MEVLFLDFDGVIADSIEETYVVSKQAFYGFLTEYNEASARQLFYQNRGLVGPPAQFLSLHQAVYNVSEKSASSVKDEFFRLENEFSIQDKKLFEALFFAIRKQLQGDPQAWAEMNPLTDFGRRLSGRDNSHCVIVTTKNIEAVQLLLDHHNISVQAIMGKSEFDAFGNKKGIISHFLDAHPEYTAASFVDDHTGHLDSVNEDSRVDCFFADWGYGKNSNYQIFNFIDKLG